MLPGIINIEAGISSGKELAVFTLKDELVGIVKLTVDSDKLSTMESGEVARPNMVLLNQDLYPRRWTTQEKSLSFFEFFVSIFFCFYSYFQYRHVPTPTLSTLLNDPHSLKATFCFSLHL